MTWVPRLRTVLIIAHLLVLGFPLGGVIWLRVYESVLIRRTESELFVQGVVVAAAYRAEWRREHQRRGRRGPPAGRALRGEALERVRQRFHPVIPRLDLARDDVAPEAAPTRTAKVSPDPAALAAGHTLNEVLARVQRSTLAGIRVLDWRGVVVATTRGELGRSLAHRPEVRQALAGARARLVRRRPPAHPAPRSDRLHRASDLRVFVSLPVVDGERVVGAVVLSRTAPSMWQTLYRRRWLLLGSALGLLALVLLLALLTAWTIGRPVRALIQQAERIRGGDREAAVELTRAGTHEVRQLSRAFVDMARTLDERAEYIRTFAANVSHEFKTPLTSIRGAVELLNDHLPEMSAEERDRFLQTVAAGVERLDRLVQGLLALARAETARPDDSRTDVVAVVGAVVERWEASDLHLSLDLDVREPAAVRMSRDALDTVVSNLVTNAEQHGGEDVRVRVRGEDALEVGIDVVDDGPGISEANRERVFDRFFTTARESGGTGLGLAIVRVLVEAHGGRVDCASRPGETRFTVTLPRVASDDGAGSPGR